MSNPLQKFNHKPGGIRKALRSAGTMICIVVIITVCISMRPERTKLFYAEPFELKYPANFGNRFVIQDDNPMTKEGVHLGRLLFYDTRLSASNKISCGTCHQQKLAFTDGTKFSTGVDGVHTRRSSMSLANILWVRNLFWDGRITTLEDQALVPLLDPHEMGQSLEISSTRLNNISCYPPLFKKAFGTNRITGKRIVKAIAQFERTLISSHAPYDNYLAGKYKPTKQELQGMNLFMTMPLPEQNIRGGNCGHCHGTPKTYKELFHNNGLDTIALDSGREQFTGQVTDRARFRVPTLRNISLTAPYMHDGRFKTLKEVLDHYSEHIQPSNTLSPFLSEASNVINGKSLLLSEEEKKSIISFLGMLTDSTFITSSKFSDPFVSRTIKH